MTTTRGLLAGLGPGLTRFDMRLRQSFKQKGIAVRPDGIQSEGLRKTRFGGSSCAHYTSIGPPNAVGERQSCHWPEVSLPFVSADRLRPLRRSPSWLTMAYLKIQLRDLVRIKRQVRGLGTYDPRPRETLPAFVCRPILVETDSLDEKGCLVLADSRLVAVLVRVASTGIEQDRKELSGWQMEAGFGRCAVAVLPLFDTLRDAVAWVREQLAP